MTHVGIIPDGNRRWCRLHEGSSADGATMGAMVDRKLIDISVNYLEYMRQVERSTGVHVREVTVYLLSKDNLVHRKDDSVEMVRRMIQFMAATRPKTEHRVCVQFVGELHLLPADMQELCTRIEGQTHVEDAAQPECMLMTMGIAYDPVEDCRRVLATPPAGDGGRVRHQTPVDVVLRSGGELRSSGFFPLHTIYSKWVYSPKLFPDLTVADFEDAMREFSKRHRRFGG